jgi:hypothetical protein
MRSIKIVAVLLAAVAWVRPASAGPYTMDYFAFGSAQTVAVAGGYQLTGGAGPSAVQFSSGGSYALQSGFWALPGSGGTVAAPAPSAPLRTALLGSVPNPFATQTNLAFELDAARPVSLGVFDLHGARVRTLLQETLPAGRHRLSWDGHADNGSVVPAGIYWVQFQSGGTRQSSRIVRLP